MKDLNRWLEDQTRGIGNVCDFGAGDGTRTWTCGPGAVGIEICPKCIEVAPKNIIAGDMLEWRSLLPYPPAELECAVFVDSLEHLSFQNAVLLLRDLQSTVKKIVAFVPEGFHPQEDDVTGHDNGHQRHLSTWWEDDFRAMNFKTEVEDDQHSIEGKDHGAIFAVWGQ